MLDEILKEALKQSRKRERSKELIGDVSPDLINKHKEYMKQKNRLDEDMELYARQLAAEMQRRLEDKFEARQDEMGVKHTEFWNSVYQAYGLDPKGSYSIRKDKLYVYTEKANEEKDTSFEELFVDGYEKRKDFH